MDRRRFFSLTAVGLICATGPAAAADKVPTEWDGLSRVKSKKLEYVFLAPGANFSSYRQVLLDPTEIAFHKDWQRDYNRDRRGVSGRVSDSDVQRAIVEGGAAASKIFADAFAKGGYPIATAPGPDVLKVRTAVVNISVTAPDMPIAGRSHTFSNEAGFASLIIEVRDSMTGALLGRVVDHSLAGDSAALLRNRVTNRADFRDIVKVWAKNSVAGLNLLKTSVPT
jgi:hypothetical protein